MEKQLFIASIAVIAAFACLFASSFIAAATIKERRTALATQGDQVSLSGLALWRIRNGFGFAAPAVGRLLTIAPIKSVLDELAAHFSEKGWSTSSSALGSVFLVAASCAALAVGVISGSPIAGIASFTCFVALISIFASHTRDKRHETIREAVPSALESMAACLGSGFTLLQTFNQVAADTPGALGKTFASCAHILEMGGSAEQALAQLREGAHASELAFVAVALDVQHQSGGAMRQVLDAATDSIKGELALRRTLRVQTAQAKLSARIVVVMPFILVAAFSLASPDFLMPFFSSAFGYALLALALIMQVAGIVLVRRALAVEGVA